MTRQEFRREQRKDGAEMLQTDPAQNPAGRTPSAVTMPLVRGGDAWVSERVTAAKGPAWLRGPGLDALRAARGHR